MNTEKINAITETILDNIHEDDLMDILRNVVKYAVENNHCKTNCTARELLSDIVSEELLEQLFDEKAEVFNQSFADDAEKMIDFNTLTKEEFLQSYSYLTEAEYEATFREVNGINKED